MNSETRRKTKNMTKHKPSQNSPFRAGSKTELIFLDWVEGHSAESIENKYKNSPTPISKRVAQIQINLITRLYRQNTELYDTYIKKRKIDNSTPISTPSSSIPVVNPTPVTPKAQNQVLKEPKKEVSIVVPEKVEVSTEPKTPTGTSSKSKDNLGVTGSVKIAPHTPTELKEYMVNSTHKYIPRVIKVNKSATTDIESMEKMYAYHLEHPEEQQDHIRIEGETGTGKTAGAREFASKNKLPYLRINFNAGVTEEKLFGRFVPTEKENGVGLQWIDGNLTKFVRYGGVVVFDEINACPPEIAFLLHPLLDAERTLTLSDYNGEIIKAHPNCFFIATMNPEDYEGTKSMNKALVSRFSWQMIYEYDSKIEKQLGIKPVMIDLAERCRLLKKEGKMTTPCDTRKLLAHKRHILIHGEDIAFENFLNTFQSDEREAIRNAYDIIQGEQNGK